MSQRTLDISAAAGLSSVRLRLVSTSTNKIGVGIKTIVISGTQSTTPGSIVSNTTVNGTHYTFTDLTVGTTYYARVKGKADWSNVVSFTTSSMTGDANGDSTIDIADVTAIINIINDGSATGTMPKAADVNGDGKVDIADVTAVINIINTKEN